MNTLKFNNYIKNYNNGLTNMISELNLKTEGYCDKILTACYSEDFYESTDDADIILEEAKEGIIQRVIEFVRKIKNEIIGFIKKISNIVREKFFSAKSKEKFDKMDDIINSNPKIKGRKVKVKDTNKINKASNETLSEINGVKNKLSSGSITGAQASKEIDMIKEKHKKRMKIATTAVLTVSIGAALMFAKKNAKSISTSDNSPGVKDVDEGEKVIKQVANSAEKKAEKMYAKFSSKNKGLNKYHASNMKAGITNGKMKGAMIYSGVEISSNPNYKIKNVNVNKVGANIYKMNSPIDDMSGDREYKFNKGKSKSNMSIKNIETFKAKEVSESVTAGQKIIAETANVVRENLTENVTATNETVSAVEKEVQKLKDANAHLLDTMDKYIDKSVEKMKKGDYYTPDEDKIIEKINDKIYDNDKKIRDKMKDLDGSYYFTTKTDRQSLATRKATAYNQKDDYYDKYKKTYRKEISKLQQENEKLKHDAYKARKVGSLDDDEYIQKDIKRKTKHINRRMKTLNEIKDGSQFYNKEYNTKRKKLLEGN